MRKWIPITLIALAVLWFILTNVGSSMALADLTARPITALQRTGMTVPVQPTGRAPEPGEAKGIGGQGVMFGLSLNFALPDSGTVTCTQRFRILSCSDGWQPLR
jgi:hypothetical protein